MPDISKPTLTITLRPQLPAPSMVTVSVRYTVTFTDFDINNKVKFQETCFIIGEDNSTPGLQSSDDELGDPLLETEVAASATPVTRFLTGTFTRSQLNEDPTVGAFDELKAFVKLTAPKQLSFLNTFRESNQLEAGV